MNTLKEVQPITKYKLLVAYIDKDWNSDYLIDYFNAVSLMVSYFRGKSEVSSFEVEPNLRMIDFYKQGLKIKSIQYNSPGWIEIILSASVVTAIVALIKHYVPNYKQVTETRKIAAEVTRLEIENLKEMGFSKKEIRVYFEPKLRETLKSVERLEFLLKLGAIVKIEGKDWDEN